MELLVKSLDYVEPELIFRNMNKMENLVFLDSSLLNDYYGRFSIIALDPLDIFKSSELLNISDQINLWENLFYENVLYCDDKIEELPFTGGLIGFFSYDLGKKLEFISEDGSKIVDDYYFGLYNKAFIFDLLKRKLSIIVAKVEGYNVDYEQQLVSLEKIYISCKDSNYDYKVRALPELQLESNFTYDEYIEAVDKAKQYIRNGDIFEVNIAQCYKAQIEDDSFCEELYLKLRKVNAAPFSAFLNLGELKIMSASPERFLSINNRKIEVRPIKGTARRSSDIEEDIQLISKLENSTKDKAENIMIVDLMRNDLSKICTKDSVNVTKLCQVETFSNVHHLVSVIEGKLKDECSLFSVIKAIFPGGSVTGAPKIRAMQIIEELEKHTKRGIYCGSIGYFSFNGRVDLSIAIRTIIKSIKDIRFYVGGAITLDSIPHEEYEETLLKAERLQEVFQ